MPDVNSASPITVDDIDTSPSTSAMAASDTHVSVEDFRAAFVRVSEENAILQQELEATQKRVRTVEILDTLIEPYAKRTFWFMCAYSGVVGVMLLMHGCEKSGFKLPGDVLTFLVGSTATTVIGLVGMVLTGIFLGARGRSGA